MTTWGRSLFVAAFLAPVAFGIACSSSSGTGESNLCTPNKASYCRCLDRREGQKVCNEEGSKWGPCEPCESFDNPVIDGEPEEPPPDGGAESTCGNGTVERGEDCDVKGTTSADGCKSCKLSGPTPFATNACPGLPVHVWGGSHRPTLQSSTTGSGKRNTTIACGTITTTGLAGPDRVFDVTAHANGNLIVDVTTSEFDAFIWVADECGAEAINAVSCANDTNGVGSEGLSIPVTSGQRLHVFVDGTGTQNAGNFKVTFSIVP
jgi:cysteine-rich repeat protein